MYKATEKGTFLRVRERGRQQKKPIVKPDWANKRGGKNCLPDLKEFLREGRKKEWKNDMSQVRRRRGVNKRSLGGMPHLLFWLGEGGEKKKGI